MLVNPLIDVDGDQATVRAYLMVLRGQTVSTTGTYEDALVRLADGWRFSRRVFSAGSPPPAA